MGKIHHKRMKQPEQDHDHGGWMSGFISLFDFRRGGSNHRLLHDKRFGNKVRGEGLMQDMTGSVDSEYKFDYDAHDSSVPMLGVGKQSAENLNEEKMVMENNTKHKSNNSFLEYVDFAKDEDTNTLVREIFIRIQQNRSGGVEQEQKDNFCVLPEKVRANFVEQFTDATKVLLQEKLIGRVHVGLDGKIQYSREFIDALEILISHKDLFFKLLEDPNSELSRRINNLINSELGKCADQKESEGLHYRKPSLFSRIKVRSQEVRLLSGDENSEVPRSSAILEPGSETSSNSYSINSSQCRSKNKSSFFFTEIKRRLKRVMRKDKEEVFTTNEMAGSISRRYLVPRAGGDSFGRMSPSRNPHLEAEIHPRRLSNSGWSDFESTETVNKALENEIVKPSEKKISSSYVESKRHYFHVLTDDIFDGDFSHKRELALIRKSFSMADHVYSPSLHPARQSSMPTSSLRKSLSSSDNYHVPEQKNNVSAAVDLSDNSAVVAFCVSDHDFSSKFESQDPGPLISENIVFGDGDEEVKFSSELSSAAVTDADRDKRVIISEDSNLGSDKTEHLDEVTSGIDNRPSPTSVLEPKFPEDEISSPRTNIQGELRVTPLQIHFEEDEDLSEFNSNNSPFVKKSCNDNEPKLRKYIEEILTASEFSWDKSYVRYLSSDQLLDTSLYEAEMDINSNEASNDYVLLLDLLNEVLLDSCGRYFGCSPWVSLSKPNIRPISDTENSFQEIVERVESYLRPSSHPQGVEEIVTKEIFKDESWTDFRFDVETIGTEIADLILQKLIIDTALSCFSFTDKPRLIHL